jgi:iron complex transport system substrate-binding protein
MRGVCALVALLCLCGDPLPIQQRPQRIISVVPAITEMLFALGAGDRVVAVGSFDKYPPQVETLPKVGALLDPDLERILSLRPDLVAIYGSQADLRTQLERAGIPVFLYSHAGLASVSSTILELGQRIGAAERAQQLVREIEQRLQGIRSAPPPGRSPRTLIVMGRDRFALRGIYASGGYGFIHDMVSAAGGVNIFADLRQEAVQATTELIIARRPEVIIELRADPLSADDEAKELAVWRTLASVPAVRTNRVHIIHDRRTVIPGPRVAEGVEVIWRALRGDLHKRSRDKEPVQGTTRSSNHRPSTGR